MTIDEFEALGQWSFELRNDVMTLTCKGCGQRLLWKWRPEMVLAPVVVEILRHECKGDRQ